jgi:hypothetical protein
LIAGKKILTAQRTSKRERPALTAVSKLNTVVRT